MYRLVVILLSISSFGLANPVDLLSRDPHETDSPSNLTIRSELNGPCTGANGAPGVCLPTASCTSSGGRYISNACPGTPDNVKCCTKTSCSSGGNCRWTSQCSSGNTASGFCPGPNGFKCCLPSGGGNGGGGINKPISRSEIMERGRYWISKHVPYSMEKTYPDPQGTQYRTDCSGFVSMALHSNHPGYSTVSLPEIAVRIGWDDLKQGDFVGTLGAGTGGANGHVVLFHSWKDSGRTRFNTYECRGSQGCVQSERPKAFTVGTKSALPYRYKRVI